MPADQNTFTTLLAGASKALQGLEDMLPLVGLIPGFPLLEKIVSIGGGIGEIIENTQDRADDLDVALHEKDQAKIKEINARLDAINNELAKKIDAS